MSMYRDRDCSHTTLEQAYLCNPPAFFQDAKWESNARSHGGPLPPRNNPYSTMQKHVVHDSVCWEYGDDVMDRQAELLVVGKVCMLWRLYQVLCVLCVLCVVYEPWSTRRSRPRSRSRDVYYFSNVFQRKMNHQSQPSFTQHVIKLSGCLVCRRAYLSSGKPFSAVIVEIRCKDNGHGHGHGHGVFILATSSKR